MAVLDLGTSADSTLFSYTSGRFLYNEDVRLKEQYIEFNVDALRQTAVEHLGSRHGKVAYLTKAAEGGLNRVFLLTTEDGFQAVAKIPYRITVPHHYATASKAATLEYLRSKGILVPRFYGYSPTTDNPVGVEYIIMEKAPGVSIERKWIDMTKKERHTLASSFVEIERKFLDISFGSIRSVYFKRDIALHLQASIYAGQTICSGTGRGTRLT